jgi:predicted nuclease of predicted toxin-antitoxin system
VKTLVDAQLPPALAKRLQEQGHDSSHVADIGLAGSPDDSIWALGAQTGAVIICKDENFALMRIWFPEGPAVIWVRLGNLRRLDLLNKFDSALSQLVAAIERGDKLIELAD